GPFRWGERVPGDHIQLNAHAGYHGKGPYVERVVFKYIPDLTVLYTQFRTGQVDYAGLQGILPNFVQEAKTLKGRNIFVYSTTSGNAVREQTQQLLIQDWRAIGAAMRVNNMPAAVIWGDFWQQSKFNSVIVGVNFMLGSDPDVTPRFGSGAIPAKGGRGSN